MAVVNKSSWRPYWRISPPETLPLFYIDFFFKKSSCMYIPIPRSTFWQNCIFGLLVDISSLSLPQISGFSSSVLLTRLILTSRNSYCLVHHLDSITRLLIILIVREKKEWERERVLAITVFFVVFRFRSSSTLTTCITQWTTYQGRF